MKRILQKLFYKKSLSKNPDIIALFDKEFYLANYPEIASQNLSAIEHYLTKGYLEGKNPNPLIDSKWYLLTYANQMEHVEPLADFVLGGWKKGRNPNPLFDVDYYLHTYSDIKENGINPLFHYLKHGATEWRNPSAEFDTLFYSVNYPDVAKSGMNPLFHYIKYGVHENRKPTVNENFSEDEFLQPTASPKQIFDSSITELFDEEFYLSQYPDGLGIETNALEHYIKTGFKDGKNPNTLFITDYYLGKYADVKQSGMNPLIHYAKSGADEGRWVNEFFNSEYYLSTYLDVAEAGLNPLYHFLCSGAKEGRNPSAKFNVNFYCSKYSDVAQSNINPLVHYIKFGMFEGRETLPPQEKQNQSNIYFPPENLLPWFSPLNLELDSSLSNTPYLNVLVPGLAMKHMSGGPNTALNLAGRLAGIGVPVRFCSTNAPLDLDTKPFWDHVCRLADLPCKPRNAELVDMSNRVNPHQIGENDLFMATAWWTAQMAKYAVKMTKIKTFIYLIQDYEPVLHAASTPQALAEESYSEDHIGIINTELLHEFLVTQKVGLYADKTFAKNALVFNPAVDRQLFYPIQKKQSQKRQFLFYARPQNGLRNLFEIGVAALQKCIFEGVLDPAVWNFIGMGESFPPLDLGAGCVLRSAPWQDLNGYAAQMRETDVLLSLMMSPHPSYPPLEMALCGRSVITNTYFNKSAERLAEFSPNIIGVIPTIEGVSEGIKQAVKGKLSNSQNQKICKLPCTWDEAFKDIVPQLKNKLLELFGAPLSITNKCCNAKSTPLFDRAIGFQSWPKNAYEVIKYRRQAERDSKYTFEESNLFSFLTTVWNTPAEFLDELAESVFNQDSGTDFEWIILDNGTINVDTIKSMARIASHPCVKFLRVENNLGIIGGMRHVLSIAENRYIIPLDSDDLLTPDCVRILSHYLKEHNYPALAYTDEDKIFENSYRDPYDKPAWDPVLFFHSCYIAHLGCIDRVKALDLGVYSDDDFTGCHDYDTFTRFYLAGYEPLHIPEIVYSWRMHIGSTAGNITSKDYISSSQKKLLQKFLDTKGGTNFVVEPSPLFNNTPDWRLVRPHTVANPIVTIWFGEGESDILSIPTNVCHKSIELPIEATAQDLAQVLKRIKKDTLINLRSRGCKITDTDWYWETVSLMELFSDTVMIGSIVYLQECIVAAPGHFGIGRGCESPDIGRNIKDPGYFAQMLKPHSVACVPIENTVIDLDFLRFALDQIGSAPLFVRELSPWLGAIAQLNTKRVVYTPFMRTELIGKRADNEGGNWLAFRTIFPSLIQNTQLLSARLSRKINSYYCPITLSDMVEEQLELSNFDLSYTERARSERLVRQFGKNTVLNTQPKTIGFMTSVYIRTDAKYLQELIESVKAQTISVTEWIILENGPICNDVANVLRAAKATLPINQLKVGKNLGIQGAMAYCLNRAKSEFVCSLDADDLLEPDVIKCVQDCIAEHSPDMIFTDEDHIIDGKLQAPFRRGGFDPILNAIDSYIFHFVIYKREMAVALNLYNSAGAEYCHDWDSITKFYKSGAKLYHIPSVLYHWRMHTVSTSGSGEINSETQKSVEWMLNQNIICQKDPSLYEVAFFPLNRGVPQLTIQRKPINPLPMSVIIVENEVYPTAISWCSDTWNALKSEVSISKQQLNDTPLSARMLLALNELDKDINHIMITSSHLVMPSCSAIFEAMRLFEMHQDIGAIGGRVYDMNKKIVETGNSLFRDVTCKTYEWKGMSPDNPGPFALALKPQTVNSLSPSLFFVQRNILYETLIKQPLNTTEDIANSIIDEIAKDKLLCAYSPLIESYVG